jgi:hypothetical protein
VGKHWTDTIRVTGVPTHHFIGLNILMTRPILVTTDGRIEVYLDQTQAMREIDRRFGSQGKGCVIGMGDEKWALFQAEHRPDEWVLVPLKGG